MILKAPKEDVKSQQPPNNHWALPRKCLALSHVIYAMHWSHAFWWQEPLVVAKARSFRKWMLRKRKKACAGSSPLFYWLVCRWKHMKLKVLAMLWPRRSTFNYSITSSALWTNPFHAVRRNSTSVSWILPVSNTFRWIPSNNSASSTTIHFVALSEWVVLVIAMRSCSNSSTNEFWKKNNCFMQRKVSVWRRSVTSIIKIVSVCRTRSFFEHILDTLLLLLQYGIGGW